MTSAVFREPRYAFLGTLLGGSLWRHVFWRFRAFYTQWEGIIEVDGDRVEVLVRL